METPYVNRSRDYCKELKQYIYGKKIVIGTRQWDGIDRPDYTPKFTLSPDEARYVANDLWKIAEEIDGKTKKQSVLKQIRKNTESIIKKAKTEAMK